MQFSYKQTTTIFVTFFMAILLMASFSAFAGKDKVYTENEFLDNFSGKSQKIMQRS